MNTIHDHFVSSEHFSINSYIAQTVILQFTLYIPGWDIQPLQSVSVIALKLANSAVSVSNVPSKSMLFNSDFTFENASSIGLKSGEYGGRK